MESDRVLVEIASYLRARIMIGEEVGVGALKSASHVHGADGGDAGRSVKGCPAE